MNDIVISGGVSSINEILNYIHLIGKNGFLHAFEPSQFLYNSIKSQLTENESNVKLYKYALSSSSSAISYFDDKTINSVLSEKGNKEVSSTTIDNIIQDRSCNVIKLNINGTEYDALIGAKQVIQRNYPLIQVKLTLDNLIRIPKLLLNYSKNNYQFDLRYFDLYNNLNNIILYAFYYK